MLLTHDAQICFCSVYSRSFCCCFTIFFWVYIWSSSHSPCIGLDCKTILARLYTLRHCVSLSLYPLPSHARGCSDFSIVFIVANLVECKCVVQNSMFLVRQCRGLHSQARHEYLAYVLFIWLHVFLCPVCINCLLLQTYVALLHNSIHGIWIILRHGSTCFKLMLCCAHILYTCFTSELLTLYYWSVVCLVRRHQRPLLPPAMLSDAF